MRFLRAKAQVYGIDSNRIGVWGTSAGGHLAALLGTSGGEASLEGKGGWQKYSSRVQVVCDYFGPTNLLRIAEMLELARLVGYTRCVQATNLIAKLVGGPLDEKKDVCKQASPITYVSKDDPPFLIVHGNRDNLVPLHQSQEFHEALTKAGVTSTFHVVKGAGHGFPNRPELTTLVIDFFDKNLAHRRVK